MKPVLFITGVLSLPLPEEGVWWSGPGAAGQQTGQGRPETSEGVGGAGAGKGAAHLNIQIELCSDLLPVLNSVVYAATPGVVLWVQRQNWVQHWRSDGRARQVWRLMVLTAGANQYSIWWMEIYEWHAFILELLQSLCCVFLSATTISGIKSSDCTFFCRSNSFLGDMYKL